VGTSCFYRQFLETFDLPFFKPAKSDKDNGYFLLLIVYLWQRGNKKMKRSSGIFLHPTSLTSPFGIGDIGSAAYEWITTLKQAGQTFWQVCPLGPTGYGDSPYQCLSSFAGNTLLISPVKLMESGLISREDISCYKALPGDKVDYQAVFVEKEKLFRKAYSRFTDSNEFLSFCEKEKYWLDDYSLYRVIKDKNHGVSWNEWNSEFKLRYPAALDSVQQFSDKEIRYHKFLQFIFHDQWAQLKACANSSGISIIGDLPIYVALDSADTWALPDYFEFDENCNPSKVAGVPPDYFSATGQLWGNPIYKWDSMRVDRYSWWISRIKKTLQLVDVIRLDHFRGFESFWAIPSDRSDAVVGEWQAGPGIDFFNQVRQSLGALPIIAEDLGNITPQVIGLRLAAGIPGMKVLQFAFDGDPTNWHLPYNIVPDNIVYTGTHDNDTTLGWFMHLEEKDKKTVLDYLGCGEENMVENFIRMAYASPANLCITPMQDVLELDSAHRMNTPGTKSGNWQWRFTKNMLSQGFHKIEMLADFSRIYGRSTVEPEESVA
jgi:4-alpha-glucanotransferase